MELIKDTISIAKLEFKAQIIRSKSIFIINLIVEPLAYLFLLSAGLGGLIGQITLTGQSIDYITFVLPGIIALRFLRSFTYSIYRLVVDRRWGLQSLKLLSGISPTAYIIGILAVPFVIFLVQGCIIYIAGTFMGAMVSMRGFLTMMAIGSISVCFWTGLAVLLTTLIKNYEQRDLLISLLMLPLTLSAPIFYSFEKAPIYLKLIAQLNPLSYQVRAMREAYLNGSVSGMVSIPPIFLAIAFLVLSVQIIKKSDLLPSEI